METQKLSGEAETGCILCTCKRAKTKKSNLRPAQMLHVDSASHEISVYVPQKQPRGQGNTQIERRSRNWLYIIGEYNSKT